MTDRRDPKAQLTGRTKNLECISTSLRPTASDSGDREMRMVYVTALAATAVTAMFCTKAFHIDDPLFLYVARGILSHPFRPLDLEINWDIQTLPISQTFGNPPGFCYVLALLHLLGAKSEVTLHLALAPLFGGFVLGTARLARVLGMRPLLPAILVACSPAALVCATTLMPDMFAALVCTFGAALWIEGDSAGKKGQTLTGGGLLACAAFCRYNAVACAVALMLYCLLRRRRAPISWVALALAPAFMLLWNLAAGGLTAISSLSSPSSVSRSHHALVIMADLALACSPPLFALLSLARRASLSVLAGTVISVALAFGLSKGYGFWAVVPVVIFASFGAGIVVWVVIRPFRWRKIWEERTVDAFLAGWLLLSLLVPIVYIHASAKYLLPVVPALAVVATRGIGLNRMTIQGIATISLLAFLSIAAAVADLQLADAHRTLVKETIGPLVAEGRRVWFANHWGFHWYAAAEGARALENNIPPRLGEIIVMLETASPGPLPDPDSGRYVKIGARAIHSRWPLRTMNSHANAGFYSDSWGLLPFGISTYPVEQLVVLEVQ